MTSRITVLLAEDHEIVREGFRKLLDAEADIEVVGEAQTGRAAVALTRKLQPAVVVMDIAMPLLNGLEATRQILAVRPSSRVLILSAHSDDAYVRRALECGATGFLLKQASSHDLANAIREVHKGRPFFSPSIAKRFHASSRLPPKDRAKRKLDDLTPRELEVLQLIVEGLANKQVAAELGISIKTVEKHRQNLMVKLDIHDTAGLTRYAIGAGIIESSVQVTIV
jgi:DNA-binding NarL/FixJ family response regulator